MTVECQSGPAEKICSIRPSQILVVEDERHIARLLDYVLRKEGYEVAVVHSAEQALELVGRSLPDALLLDMVLPGMSGMDFLRVVRAAPYELKCVAILLSGHSFDQSSLDADLLRPCAQCSKPIAPTALLRKLKEFGVLRLVPAEK